MRWSVAIAVTSLLGIGVRFWGLSDTPNGFYVDEAAPAAQVMCVATTGHDASGNSWPLYADVLGGGQASIVMLYPASLWYHVFGGSIASLRAFDVTHGVVALMAMAGAVYAVSRSLVGALAAFLIGLCSPWWFTASRVFWDPVVGATWWTLSLSLYFAGRREDLSPQRRTLLWSLAAVAAAGAAYGYPPLRAQLAVAALWIACLDRPWRHVGWRMGIPAVLGLVLLLPLASAYAHGDTFAGRGNWLAVWSEDWLRQEGHSMYQLPFIVLRNLALHLDPAFLFLRGDANLRHSTGFGGILGATGLVVPLAAFLIVPRFARSRTSLLLLGLYLAGLLGAALTWEGQPHALRSVGSVGPLLLWLGMATATIVQSRDDAARRARLAIAIVAIAAFARFGYAYFVDYHDTSLAFFSGAPESVRGASRPGLARLYYDMQYREQPCTPSQSTAH